ncbi:TetR/AcrR family transcriptional regulator [Diaphorobacter ruginosibacter]|uniref:TetR/AcrR family transcriptional regulator n=1 Tax=Diaphorobacter ruginosibacter TaxID=1715720 RepID=UPI00334170F2
MVSSENSRIRKHGEHKSSAAVRARILETSFNVISTNGYSGMTMAKVASMSGLPIGSVYWHFESKDLLLNAMIEDSFSRWHRETAERNKPMPGESFEQHVTRIFGSATTPKYFAADFWRLGVILSVEKSVPEQTARAQFLNIRETQREELSTWWRSILPTPLLKSLPGLPNKLSSFTLAMQDGNAIAGASGESLDDFQSTLVSCLVHLVAQAQASVHGELEDKPKPKRTRAARVKVA